MNFLSTSIAVGMAFVGLCTAIPHPDAEPDVLPVLMSPASVLMSRAYTGHFQAWSGQACNGNAGGVKAVDNVNVQNCVGTAGRHTFKFTQCNGRIFYFEKANCQGTSYLYGDSYKPGQCYLVNTGKDWNSAFVSCA